ncbi:LacI family DNA-binding transcriptional regulator [Limosilactobacillus sp. STM2_1]|uniref:LacI family DNA-binding transcriptional regulator n=1 Tax=Limosilactobacillus rudii TaxID=2759755 RepID=A0A7W3YMX9_9LACO|nr:LacI family DNA-binding transcriptional regulator [Limosilactobacillus rudii]MBB1079164.1 LacI family DNA-binding transcriptional regulator [Limosilactobacillus rudii]MBB1096961.1 LacI family DNA-binding transcriptional regulator [Limosilactobacillus rudii]MCD7133929.1 LacI family DNA-binding transcriptional regulator [Limosilactobacillus rudii]
MVGIRKIAKEAGVSPATVSRVLNNDLSFSVSKQTKQRIKTVADKYHYIPQSNRQISHPQRQFSLLVITTHSLDAESHDPYFAQVHDGIVQEASKLGLQIKDFIRFPNKQFQFTDAKKYDGIIIAGVFVKEFYAALHDVNPNIVLIDEYRYLPAYDIIGNSYFAETQVVLTKMLNNGFNKIGFIGGNISPMNIEGLSTDTYQDIRTRSYIMWMKEHNLAPQFVLNGWTPKDGFLAMKTLLPQNPQVVLVASDQLAVGAYRAINQYGKSIPKDLQIISYNDSSIAAYLVPSLSSITPHSLTMGKIAVQRLIHRLQSPKELPVHINLPAGITWRESSQINLK